MNKKKLKKMVAKEVIKYIHPGMTIGVGTGSTVIYFINELKKIKNIINGTVSSSNNSTLYLRKNGIKVFDVNTINSLQIYIDSADEVDLKKRMIKGGGGALTGEKIIAALADIFICIVDESKQVQYLGKKFPVPIEVIPMAQSFVMQEIVKLGGIPIIRKNFVTDNGNIIIDIFNLNIIDPINTEMLINSITGVVTVGIFAKKPADLILLSNEKEVLKY
ncbi:Ribose-5-phosphate isomerase A [Buchnera aphidicola (Thelaxes suberi)]|uniref:ribose-5-phosphate isomerase RpiA n=1 Tax=Buchnera aphidicola TaxID=9 RepID=UPI003464BF8D